MVFQPFQCLCVTGRCRAPAAGGSAQEEAGFAAGRASRLTSQTVRLNTPSSAFAFSLPPYLRAMARMLLMP